MQYRRRALLVSMFPERGGQAPRALECADDGEGNPLGCAYGIRGPSPYGEGWRFFHRSAGACPPRSQHGEGNPLACAYGIRGPKPYDEGGLSAAALLHRDQEVSPTGRKKSRLFNAPHVKLSHHNTTTETTLCP